MSTTSYVTNYTLIDSVNAQLTTATQYNSNEGAATLTTDSYATTSSSVYGIPTALLDLNPGAILDDGFSQKALYELFLMIARNWDNAMIVLDDDAGVATTTYEANCAICSVSGDIGSDYDSSFTATTVGLKAIGGQEAKIGIHPSGMGTREIAIFCQAIATQFAACTALLDADGTLSDTNYASTLDLDFAAATGGISTTASATPIDITLAESYIKTTGIKHGALVSFLNSAITNINALWTKLDADI